MPMYQVLMNAENFLVDLEGTLAKHGFCTSRFVEAASADRAELAAVEMLRNDQDLRAMIKNQPDDPPVINVTEVQELDVADEASLEQPGRVWYEMKPKRWWQFWR